MAECSGLATCPFFNDKMKDMPALAEMLKRQFCRGTFEECARYIVKKDGKIPVSGDLYPNQKDRALRLIGQP